MAKYIFITPEGYTFQPGSDSAEPDIDNLQVLGFADGNNSDKAFQNLIKDTPQLKQTSFKEVISYKLDDKREENRNHHLM